MAFIDKDIRQVILSAPSTPPGVSVQNVAQQCDLGFSCCQTPAVDIVMDVERATGAAQRRRERRLRGVGSGTPRTAVQLALAEKSSTTPRVVLTCRRKSSWSRTPAPTGTDGESQGTGEGELPATARSEG